MRLLSFVAILAAALGQNDYYQDPNYANGYYQYYRPQTNDLSPAGSQNVNSQYISMEVQSRSAGTLPLRAVVKFVPSIDLVANTHTIIVQETGIRGAICGGWTTPGWTLFVGGINLQFNNNTAVQPLTHAENKGEDLQDIRFAPAYEANTISTVPISSIGAIVPFGRGITALDGLALIVTLETSNGVILGVNTPTTGDFRLKAAVQYEMFIPQRFLSPNLEYPRQTVSTSLGFINTNQLTVPVPFKLSLLDYVVSPLEVIAPFTISVPEIGQRSLLFLSAVPSTTIAGQQLNSLTISAIFGIGIPAGGYIGIEADQNIFARLPNNNVVNTIAIGYNCAAFPELCCSTSVVTTRPQGDGGMNPLIIPAPGWSQMRIQLAPKGCMIPKDKLIVFQLTTQFLGKNPPITSPWEVTRRPFNLGTATAVNIRLFSSREPSPVNVAMLSEPRHPVANGVTITPNAAGFSTFRLNRVPLKFVIFDIVSWSTYVVGASTVKDFSATPTTTQTNVVPDRVTFQFRITSADILNRSAATLNAAIISAQQGVFRPNQGKLDSPNSVESGALPGACQSVKWYTNAYGSLILLLNPLFNVQAIPDSAAACAAALQENVLVVVTIPGSAFLPNIAAGQWVRFDIRMVDPFMDNQLQLYFFGPTGGWLSPRINSADTATLMNQNGWFTTAGCGSGTIYNLQSGLVTDIRALTAEARCEIVCAMGLISPVSGGILQCPNTAQAVITQNVVTFVKVPEAAFNGLNWPASWTTNTPYPTPIFAPNNLQFYIPNFGYIIDSPMFAVVVVYPPAAVSYQALGLRPNVPSSWTVLLIVRMDRLTESCQVLLYNPWEFIVVTNKNIVQCLYFPSDGSNLAGTPLDSVTWGARHFWVPGDGAVVCWTAVVASPTPVDNGSDDALFGLLALIAVPILLCYCLLALLWFLRPKREAPCCVPETPVQEMYWVTAQQPAPVYMVEQVAAPTPVYVIQ